MTDKCQPLVRDFFSKVNPEEFDSQICSSVCTPASFIPLVTKTEQKEYQKGRQRQNMRDSHNRRKVKNIAEEKRDTEGKVIKNHSDALNMWNGIGGEDQNFSDAMTLSTNNLRPYAQKQKQIEDIYVEKEAHIQSRVQKNWFHLHILPAIDQTAQESNFSP